MYNWAFMNLFIYWLAFFFFVAIPIGMRKDYRKEILIITPTELIQRVGAKDFVFINFDDRGPK